MMASTPNNIGPVRPRSGQWLCGA